ncbi:MAG: agmatine deiminase family protein [Gammaproteobacteria bacterium]|nr:agmatine deiminase family protein [Gammaproteobacteria bacterium]
MLIPEFAPQSGIVLTWPHARSDWRDLLADITPVYIDISRAVTATERLLVICYDNAHRDAVRHTLETAGVTMAGIRFTCVKTNDTWVRDYGPLCSAFRDTPILHHFTFDGWDGKYPASLDNEVTGSLHTAGLFGGLELRNHPLVLEGGSIDSDGCGSLLTTARCLTQTGRNPGVDRTEITKRLCDSLGMEQVLWLDHGEIIGDDTDGHIDMLARFCSKDTIAFTGCDRRDDPHYAPLRAMASQLEILRNTAGQPYRLVPLPLPQPCFDEDNQRLPASYANFLILNDTVLMPAYNDPADTIAADTLAACFPTRDIIPIDCRPLIRQGGSLHCATMQLPAGVLVDIDE